MPFQGLPGGPPQDKGGHLVLRRAPGKALERQHDTKLGFLGTHYGRLFGVGRNSSRMDWRKHGGINDASKCGAAKAALLATLLKKDAPVLDTPAAWRRLKRARKNHVELTDKWKVDAGVHLKEAEFGLAEDLAVLHWGFMVTEMCKSRYSEDRMPLTHHLNSMMDALIDPKGYAKAQAEAKRTRQAELNGVKIAKAELKRAIAEEQEAKKEELAPPPPPLTLREGAPQDPESS